MDRGPRDAGGENLTLDACLELLSNRQRRAMVRFFLENEIQEIEFT